jgi:glycosyltransferase involved in cell wall biosynthesis/ubiquinone/menaquinone biosynthesis C-methylase UbiE
MIPFLSPYFDQLEVQVFQSQQPPTSVSLDQLIETLHSHFKAGEVVLANSGEEAIRLAVEYVKEVRDWTRPTIAIPSAICGSVYRAVKNLGGVMLMDVDGTWNCQPDNYSDQADILLFASLSGKRMEVPARRKPDQVIIDDSAQCFDGVSGFRKGSDFSIFSFGNGKQMFAGGGGFIYSAVHDLSGLQGKAGRRLSEWQIYLMASQLSKIAEINERSRSNGLKLLEQLRDLPWLRLPDPTDHVFAKFIIFIDQGGLSSLKPQRTPEIINFMRHMSSHGVQVEETYIPLHVRFPDELKEKRYKGFRANRDWVEAITLPCRPNLHPQELGRIITAVRSYQPITRRLSVPVSYNQRVYEASYSAADLQPKQQGDYFGNLFHLRLELVRRLGQGKRMLDLGCGGGAYLVPLLEEGFEVVGLDFSRKLLNELKQEWRRSGGVAARLLLHHADARAIPEPDKSFDLVFSLSTLYHVPKVEQVIEEVWRVLKEGGLALLEFGNLRSLNTIEASRASTGVTSYHVRLGWLDRKLRQTGFEVVERRAFQLFPLYGGGSPQAVRLINPLLRRLLAEKANKKMLDELVSSSPLLSKFAFRHLMVLRKERGFKQGSIIRSQATTDMARWNRPEAIERRDAAKQMFSRGNVAQAVESLVELLKEEPSDALSVLALAEMYDNPEERFFVQKCRQVCERATRIFDTRATQASISNEQLQTTSPPRHAARTSSNPRVSVVLPTYNQASMLSKAVRSVVQQTYRNFELIVVNDGSTDGTQSFLESLHHPQVRVIHQENRRLPGALNTGFCAAQGDLLTWVSSDNYCAPYFLEALVGALDAYPEAGLAYADFFFIDEQDRILGRVSVPHFGHRSLFIRNDGNAAFLYRRVCMETVGPYDTELEGAEDWDYWLRIAEHFSFVYVPEALYYYRLHPDSMQNTKREKVNQSVIKMMQKTLARRGGKIDLSKLYPSLLECTDRKRALLAASFDFGTSLLRARVRLPDLAKTLLTLALDQDPGFAAARFHLALAQAYEGRWEQAREILDRVIADNGSLLVPKVAQLKEICGRRSARDLESIALAGLDKESLELFQREAAYHLRYSPTGNALALPISGNLKHVTME